MSLPIALLASDLHLSLTAPIARKAEKDWLKAQLRAVQQLSAMQADLGFKDKLLPILCAGDIFDRWHSPPELVNWALLHLPHMIAVPGNHDMRYGCYDDLKKTSFYTLVRAHKLTLLEPGKPVQIGEMQLHGFPAGSELRPCQNKHSLALDIAVVHKYCWIKGKEHPQAVQDDRAKNVAKQLDGYDKIVIGDNHQSFQWERVFNVGLFQRRKMNEINYKPSVGILYDDGKIERHWLDCSADLFIEPDDAIKLLEEGDDVQAFVKELADMGEASVDFAESLRAWIRDKNVREPVARAVLQSLEGKQ